jgi:hypothetical protein
LKVVWRGDQPASAWLSVINSSPGARRRVIWIVSSILRQLGSLLLENSPVDRHEPLFNAGPSNI